MPFDLEKFKPAYEKWVEESQADYNAGNRKYIFNNYPFIVPDKIPWTKYIGDPAKQTIAIVTSGGFYLKNSQSAFETESIHGDTSFREIPKTVRMEELGIAHANYDHSLAEEDMNVILPIDRLHELEQQGIIGHAADTHYSFSYVNDVVTLVEAVVPDFISKIKAAAVDILLLVPV